MVDKLRQDTNGVKKLVRDRIPEIIESHNEVANYYVAAEDEYRSRLIDKLFEEAGELKFCLGEPHAAEEIADVMEVVEAIIKNCGLTTDEVIKIKEEKKIKRGGFEKRYVLYLK